MSALAPTPTLTGVPYILRRIAAQDASDLLRLYSDPRTTQFLPLRLTSLHEAERVIADYESCWQQRGYGLWSVRERGTDKMVGRCGFLHYEAHDAALPEYELAYMFEPDVWGRGLATVCAAACLEFAFDVRGFDRVFAKTSELNVGSWRVMEKVGMEKIRIDKFTELHKVCFITVEGAVR